MTSPVDICSNALLMLGAKPIASFDEAAPAGSNLDRARLCSNLYPMVKADVLRSHPWHCAIKRVQLSPDDTAPAFGYTYRFLQPSDWLRTLGVGDGRVMPYATEGRYYLADDPVFPLVYLADIPETQFDGMLVAVMTLSMAVRLAYPVTASNTTEDARYRELQLLLKQARAVNAQDDPPQTLGGSPLLSSRFGSTWLGAR